MKGTSLPNTLQRWTPRRSAAGACVEVFAAVSLLATAIGTASCSSEKERIELAGDVGATGTGGTSGTPGAGASAANPEGVGDACSSDDDCRTGECYVGPDAGYCTTACTMEGSTSECPPDTVCKPIHGDPARCLLVCGSDSACSEDGECPDEACPDGSQCVTVADTSLRACEPNPK